MRSSAREGATQAAKAFGIRLQAVLNQLALTRVELADRCEIDSSTLNRICNGESKPLYETTLSIVRAIFDYDRALGQLLGRDLLDLFAAKPIVSADYNRDGKEDLDDLILAAAAVVDTAGDLLMSTLAALEDHKVTNEEAIELTAMYQRMRDHVMRHERLVMMENDKWARKRLSR